ncbi:unnamed protein product [Alopecurus aequalis]
MEQQPPQPPAAQAAQSLCWEQFLHKKTIRVLLVETDDSTRQVVTALLRHCMYQVIPAENGQQAWEYLQDLQTNIDLVLTEIVPGMSGISLLDKITSHNVCKNIPVIMMSSDDSMNTVFECLSKGAADFLGKPVRKNELKNLWQHVWRRCQNSSGSGSGSRSDIQTEKCAKAKSRDASNNNSGSNDRNGDTSMGLNARDGSDNGSGTQSSWTKRAVEIDSPQDMSPDQSSGPADSTCAHVIQPKSEICSNRLLPGTNNKNCKEKETNDEFKGKELNTEDQSSPNECSVKSLDRRCQYPPLKNSKGTIMENLEEPLVRAADLIGSMAKNMDAQQAARAKDSPNCSSKFPEGKEADRDGVMPSLELSLKRPRSTGDGSNAIQEEQRNVFRRSDLSAFARYNTCVVSNQGGAGFAGSCSPCGNSSGAAKTDCTYNNMKSSSDAGLIKQGSNGSSNNNDMGSTTKNVVTKPVGNKVSPINGKTHTSAFHRVQQSTLVTAGKDKAEEVGKKNAVGGKDKAGEAESKQPYAVHVENGGSAGVPQSNVTDPSAPVEGHAANYGSNSGSNNNTNNGSSAATAAAAVDVETGGVDKRMSNIMYLKRERRVAAVKKFREKRKERNFGKKVRYQSRKRLAEQRPRVRGQFVRQLPPVTAAAVER